MGLLSCANIKKVHRVEVVLDSYQDLYYSNLETDPYDDATSEDGVLKYDYFVVFQNKSESKAFNLHLLQSKVLIDMSTRPLNCVDAVSKTKGTLLIQPGKTHKIKCSIELSSHQNESVLYSDQVASLRLKVEDKFINFPFKLKIEDFE